MSTIRNTQNYVNSGSDITDLSTSHNSSGSPGQASGNLPPEYQAFGEAEQAPLVYGLSGHHILYHSRDPAFALFQDSAAAEFLVAASVNDSAGTLSSSVTCYACIGRCLTQACSNALAADLDKFASNREDTVADLATKHGKKEEYIRALLMSETRYPEARAPTLRNALIHRLSEEAKQEGITIHLHELQAIADVRLSTEEFLTDEVAALIATLNKHCNHKTRGLQATNTASAVDARSVADKTQTSCGALDAPSMPTFVSTGNAAAFCLQVLKMPALDILRLYEQWVIKSNQVKSVPKTLQAIRHQITELMDALLPPRWYTSTSRSMFALLQKLKIMGWPLDIPFVNPSKIGLIGSLRRIRDDILAGLIYFEALSLLEERALQAEVDAMTAAQGGRTKGRKTRTDKGKTHTSCQHRADSGF
ncbi:hypothetical protein B0H14DRAFT_3697105 [Mycena olivaceomarginata]|nr:hypothetical protein B0H14DRAFT_3697105 [Mycena olivaceomarginata]